MGAGASQSTPMPTTLPVDSKSVTVPLSNANRLRNANLNKLRTLENKALKAQLKLNNIERSVIPTAPPLPNSKKIELKPERVFSHFENGRRVLKTVLCINIKINNENIKLCQMDCIQFNRKYKDYEPTTAQILDFPLDRNNKVIGIKFKPWNNNTWEPPSLNMNLRTIYLNENKDNLEINSIKKVPCPVPSQINLNSLPAGGRMKTRKRRATKKAYKNKRRHSRGN
jgi:hypothetical protein